jgi:hypothetical protein
MSFREEKRKKKLATKPRLTRVFRRPPAMLGRPATVPTACRDRAAACGSAAVQAEPFILNAPFSLSGSMTQPEGLQDFRFSLTA